MFNATVEGHGNSFSVPRGALTKALGLNVQRPARIILLIVLAPLIALGLLFLADRHRNPGRVAYMLNIATPPSSLSVFSCESDAWTDVSMTCAIGIDPQQFGQLLSGYTFSESPSQESSFSLGLPKVGGEFIVAAEFKAQPASFKDGGMVSVFADAQREHAIVHLFIE